ncbi:MAG: hypothetical protein IT372_00905 [Polyangiaceae bacterium]|nr:hypothetical protein [Polyangiaceae bacterium]
MAYDDFGFGAQGAVKRSGAPILNPDDGNACTTDACDPATGVTHTPVNTSDNDVCTIDSCNPVTGVSHTPVNIDDNNICTTDACDPVLGISHLPISVDDGNACTADACSPATGITHTLIVCNDNNACTLDTCNPQVGCIATPVVHFSETFANNNAGWTLGTEWQIGPALASSGQTFGNPDPALDHTATIDNGVAGVVLGGNASTTLHPAYYLTSPVVNLSAVQGPVFLDFWRWLNSDYMPYMNSTIEVWNGSAWVSIWQVSASGNQDAAWTHVSYDVTAHKSASFQVRFGVSVEAVSAFIVSSWNIDDVRLVPAANCP